jgi:hypothetical protein
MKNNSGLSVIFTSQEQYYKLVDFLGKENVYLEYHSNMTLKETAIVIFSKKKTGLSLGSVGSSDYHISHELRVVYFEEYFK